MEVNLDKTCFFCLRLRTGCFLVGWYDIIYGHVMVLVYLASMYTGYFHVNGPYEASLWLDFIFTIVQLLEGAVLVYGIKYKTLGLVLLSACVGVVLMAADVVGDVLLALSFPNVTIVAQLTAAFLLLFFIGARGYMTYCVFNYYLQLKEELYLRRKIYNTIPDIIHSSLKQSCQS